MTKYEKDTFYCYRFVNSFPVQMDQKIRTCIITYAANRTQKK